MNRLKGISFVLWVSFAGLAVAACGDDAASCPLTNCDGTCVDTANDPANCGACGNVCASDEVCSLGACAASCGGGTTECGSSCVDTMVDPANCGGCDMTCDANEVCSTGMCASTCAAPNVQCGDLCIDPMTDNNFCGASGACSGSTSGEACSNGQKCVGGTCETSWFASCQEILAAGASTGDGIYQTDPTGTGPLVTVYCDMATGTTYEELAMAADFTVAQAGYEFIGVSDLSTAGQQAFINLYNLQDGLINLTPGGTSGNCCFQDGDTGTDRLQFGPDGGYMYPANADGTTNCSGPYEDAVMKFVRDPDGGGPPILSMEMTFFATFPPTSSALNCGTDSNPAYYFKRYQ